MNFFGWIREGVRQAVLMGVSEAVDDLGKPHADDDMSVRLLEVIRKGGPDTAPKLPSPHAPSPSPRKSGQSPVNAYSAGSTGPSSFFRCSSAPVAYVAVKPFRW